MKTVREMREYLKGIGSTYSFPNKDRYVERIEEMDSKEMMDYKKNEELKFKLDYEDVLTRNITKLCKLSSSFKFF